MVLDKKETLDVLLIHPPWFRLQETTLIDYPSGPCAIASVLEKIGMNVLVWNADFDPSVTMVIGGTNLLNTEELTRKYHQYLSNLNDMNFPVWREVRDTLQKLRPKIIGISVYSCSYKSALNVAKIAKEFLPGVKVILGGVHPSIDPNSCISHREVDVVVVGEGERQSMELFPLLMDGYTESKLRQIKGIVFKDSFGKVVHTPRAALIENLDELPFTGRHLLYQLERHPPAAFHMLYGFRGCPFQCIFCSSHNVWGRKARTRSADSMVDELELTYRRWGTKYFYICDDMFFLKRERAIRFFESVCKKRLKVFISVQTRGEMIDDELLIAFKRAGGQHVSVGVEVGDEEIREMIKKGNTVDDMRKAGRLLHKYGLNMMGFFMFGFPWETEEHIEKTIKLLYEIKPRAAFPYIVTPTPGTELHQIVLDMGLINKEDDFSTFYHESPEMALMASVHKEKRIEIINRVLKVFTRYNRSSMRFDMFKHPAFYLAAAQDAGLLKSPSLALKNILRVFK